MLYQSWEICIWIFQCVTAIARFGEIKSSFMRDKIWLFPITWLVTWQRSVPRHQQPRDWFRHGGFSLFRYIGFSTSGIRHNRAALYIMEYIGDIWAVSILRPMLVYRQLHWHLSNYIIAVDYLTRDMQVNTSHKYTSSQPKKKTEKIRVLTSWYFHMTTSKRTDCISYRPTYCLGNGRYIHWYKMWCYTVYHTNYWSAKNDNSDVSWLKWPPEKVTTITGKHGKMLDVGT